MTTFAATLLAATLSTFTFAGEQNSIRDVLTGLESGEIPASLTDYECVRVIREAYNLPEPPHAEAWREHRKTWSGPLKAPLLAAIESNSYGLRQIFENDGKKFSMKVLCREITYTAE